MNRLNLFSALNIRPGEGRLVGWLLIYALFMGIPNLVTETAAYSLFLAEFDAQAIPYVYIGFAIITTLSGFIYTSLEKRVSFSKFATINLLILALSLCLFRLLLQLTQARWPLVGLAIWYEASWALANLGFWSLAVRLFNVRQGKRLFGLIGIGLTLSESLTGFFIPTFVNLVGTPNLLFVAAASFTGALVVQTHIFRSFANQISTPDEEAKEQETRNGKSSLTNLFKNRYIVLIFAFAALYALAFYALDNAFYDRLESQFFDPDQLASFLGVFFGLAGMLTMVTGAFISGRFISRYGLRLGLLAMPVALVAGVGLVAVVGTFFEALVILFWLVVITKLLNEVLAYTINRAAWQVLYEPLPANQQLRAQTVVESMIKPIAGGLAGVLLLALNAIFALGAVQIAYLLLVILAAWLGVVVMLNRTYPTMLLQGLAKRRLGDSPVFTTDGSSVAALKQSLVSPHVGVVIYALNMLEEIEPESLPIFLQELLGHPATEIRLEALHRIERFGMTSVIPAIKYTLKYETTASVRGVALRTLATLGGPSVFEEICAYLEDPAPQVRLGAMVGLLRNSGGNGNQVPIAGQALVELVHSANPAERKFAAQVIGETDNHNFSQLLLKLLRDDESEVQRAALFAAKKLLRPEVWPAVIECLASAKLRTTAMAALVAGGEPVIPELKKVFFKARRDRQTLIRLIQTCGRIRGPEAIALLKDKLNFPDPQVRSHILMALSQCRYRAEDQEKIIILQKIRTEIAQAAWTLATLIDIGDDEAVSLLKTALNNNLVQHRARLLLLLSFIYDRQVILQVRNTLGIHTLNGHISDTKKAYALEVIDTLVSPKLKEMLLPLFDDLTPPHRLQHLHTHFPQEKLGRQQRLREIMSRPNEWLNPWTKACALDTIARLSAVELSETIVSALSEADPLVRETAVWTLFMLDPVLYHHCVDRLARDPSPQVIRAVKWLETGQKGDRVMLSLVERVIFLKAVSLFSETPDDVLAEVAAVLEELEVKTGQTIIEKGEPGSALYIIIDGQVQVHDGVRTLATMGKQDVFGEFSILDPGPRSASVTALEKTRLLRLEQEPFYELIDDHSVVARRIMQILVRQLRHAHALNRSANSLVNNLQQQSMKV